MLIVMIFVHFFVKSKIRYSFENPGDWCIWGANQMLWDDHPSRKKAACEV